MNDLEHLRNLFNLYFGRKDYYMEIDKKGKLHLIDNRPLPKPKEWASEGGTDEKN